MRTFLKYKKYFIVGGVVILLGIFSYLYFKENNYKTEESIINNEISIKEDITTTSSSTFFVDIKGAVNKAGVYEFSEGDKIIDAINKAGGLTKNAVTNNINLSQKLQSEMVVYIFTQSELKTTVTSKNSTTTGTCKCETIEINNCVTPKTTTVKTSETTTTSSTVDEDEEKIQTTVSNKVNINIADINELMTLSGIGEAKAKAIVAYRTENGNFNSIEDIMNVSGLGESIFEKIKDSITV